MVRGAVPLMLIKLGHHTATRREIVVLHGLVYHLIALVDVRVQVLAGECAVANIFLEFSYVCARVIGRYPFGSPSSLVGSEVGEGGSGNGVECFIALHFKLIRGKETTEACVCGWDHLLESLEDERTNFSNVLWRFEVIKWKARLSRVELCQGNNWQTLKVHCMREVLIDG